MVQSDYTVGCDAHKHFSLFAALDRRGNLVQRTRVQRTRVGHAPDAIGVFLSQFPEGTPVALETVGNWYWIVDEIEAAGCIPLLAHAAKAKVMMGNIHTRAGYRQDRQARCPRIGHPTLSGQAALGLDPAS